MRSFVRTLAGAPSAWRLVVSLLATSCTQGLELGNRPDGGTSGGGAGTGGSTGSTTSSAGTGGMGTGGATSSSGSGGTGGSTTSSSSSSSCQDQCAAGATRCSGNGVQTCAAQPSGCTDWGSAGACAGGGTCSGGTCSAVGTTLSAGRFFSCALVGGGAIKCWGLNGAGQLGIGDTNCRGDGPNEMGSNLPVVDLGAGKTAVAVSAGGSHACALLNDGSVKCWGTSVYGQLGLGDTTSRGKGANEMGDNLPAVNLGTGKSAVAVSAGEDHTCALLGDGSVKCWGYDDSGQLGLGDIGNRGDGPNEMGDNLPAVNLGTGKTAVAVTAGSHHTCALLNDGSVKCWGRNDSGQLGLGDTNKRGDEPNEMGDNLPAVNLGTGKTAVAIGVGESSSCALLSDGSLKCWGGNYFGQLGLGDSKNRGDGPAEMGDNLPAAYFGAGKIAIAVGVGAYHVCATLHDGSVKCLGRNGDGQLGLGDIKNRGDVPYSFLPSVDLGTGKTAVALDVGAFHACARLNDGSLKCWGGNGNGTPGATTGGALGLGDNYDRGDAPNEMGDNLPPVSL
jgi:alpha-tubulin suppressor-like RCC1 family protein